MPLKYKLRGKISIIYFNGKLLFFLFFFLLFCFLFVLHICVFDISIFLFGFISLPLLRINSLSVVLSRPLPGNVQSGTKSTALREIKQKMER